MAEPVVPSFRYRWVILGVCWLAYMVEYKVRVSSWWIALLGVSDK